MSQRRRAITLPNGEVIFDVIGADPGDEDEQDEDEDESTDEDDEDEDESEEPTIESLQAQLAEETSKRERAERRMKAADKAKTKEVERRQELEAQLAGKTPKSKTNEDGDAEVDSEKEELKKQLADLQRKTQNQTVFDAFREASDVSWQNDRVAFGQLDLSEVVDDEGAIDSAALKDAIKDLKKGHAYLVKPADDADEQEESQPIASGNAASGRGKRKTKFTPDAMTKKYPNLANRG